MDFNPDWVGAIASFLTTSCFIPQAWKVIRERDTHAISLSMYVLFTLGVCLWLVYGFLLNNLPMIIGNMIVVPLAATILIMKIRLG